MIVITIMALIKSVIKMIAIPNHCVFVLFEVVLGAACVSSFVFVRLLVVLFVFAAIPGSSVSSTVRIMARTLDMINYVISWYGRL